MTPDTLATWDLIAKFGVGFVLFLGIAMLIGGVLMPKANHLTIVAAHLSVITALEKTCAELRLDRDEWQRHAEKGMDAQALTSHAVTSLTAAVERMREAVVVCQTLGGRK